MVVKVGLEFPRMKRIEWPNFALRNFFKKYLAVTSLFKQVFSSSLSRVFNQGCFAWFPNPFIPGYIWPVWRTYLVDTTGLGVLWALLGSVRGYLAQNISKAKIEKHSVGGMF